MKLKIIFGLVLFLSFFLSSRFIFPKEERPSSQMKIEQKQIKEFTHLKLSGGSFDVVLKCGDNHALEISVDEEVLPKVFFEEMRGSLHIFTDSSLVFEEPIHLEINVLELAKLQISGNSKVTIKNIDSDIFELKMKGCGEVILQGKSEAFIAEISGLNKVYARDFFVDKSEVEFVGDGIIELSVVEDLKAYMLGSGKLTYYGNPEHVEEKTYGSSEIRKG